MLMCVPRARGQGLFCVAGCRLSQGVPSHPHLLLEIFSSWTVALSAAKVDFNSTFLASYLGSVRAETVVRKSGLYPRKHLYTDWRLGWTNTAWCTTLGVLLFLVHEKKWEGNKTKTKFWKKPISPPETQIIISEALLRHKWSSVAQKRNMSVQSLLTFFFPLVHVWFSSAAFL